MADNTQPIEWYLARDGQQHGPVTDAELKKIIELGYLRPTDLVWRQGMPDWSLAESVLDLKRAPPAAPPAPSPPSAASRQPHSTVRQADVATVDAGRRPLASASAGGGATAGREMHPDTRHGPGPGAGRGHAGNPQQGSPQQQGGPQAARPYGGPQSGQPGQGRASGTIQSGSSGPEADLRASFDGATDDRLNADPMDAPSRGFPWRAAAVLAVVAAAAAGGLALYRTGKLSQLPFLAAPATSDNVPVISRPSQSVREATGATSTTSVASSTATADLPQPIEKRLQGSPLWQALHKSFPEWYAERVAEIAKLSSESKSEREIEAALTRAIVDLRRRHQAEALAASPERLKAMASAFVDSLGRLSKISTSACYGYISQGEASPAIADLKSPEQRTAIEAQLATIFDAIAEGRKSPARREAPRREDYDVLSKELGQRGWSAADLQLFTDARALSRAAPEKVCQMVQDWFAAQLAVPDEGVKIRLLSEALKPVVAG